MALRTHPSRGRRRAARLAKHVDSGALVPTRSPTLSDYLTYWHAEVVLPARRPTTVAKYRTAIELYLRPGLGGHHLDKLTVATVQRYLNTRRATGDSVAKLEMIKVVLSSALSCAMREELVTRNVAQLVTLPTEPRARRTAWTAAQARVFLRMRRTLGAADSTGQPAARPCPIRSGDLECAGAELPRAVRPAPPCRLADRPTDRGQRPSRSLPFPAVPRRSPQ